MSTRSKFFSRVSKEARARTDALGPEFERAITWAQRRAKTVAVSATSGESLEAWLRLNVERLGWREPPASNSLEHLEEVLVRTIAAIQQTSNRRVRIATRAFFANVSGASAVGGITGLINLFGVASTGTAIGSISGAAATSAQYYLLGSLVGGGAALGSFILAASGIGVGLVGAYFGARHVVGSARKLDDLEDHEAGIIYAASHLLQAVREQRGIGKKPNSAEMRIVAEQALIPLANQINQHWSPRDLKDNELDKNGCRPFTKTLNLLPLKKLDRCRTELGRIALAAIATDVA